MACIVTGLILVIVIAIFAVLFSMSDRSKWLRAGTRCAQCGYDMATLVKANARATCPECGSTWVAASDATNTARVHTPKTQTVWVLVLVWVVIGAILLMVFTSGGVLRLADVFGMLKNRSPVQRSDLQALILLLGALVWGVTLAIAIRSATRRPDDMDHRR